MTDDPYKVLGISEGASKEEIKKAYRKKAKECHPDLHPDDPAATEEMHRVNEAYERLMNPEKYQSRTPGGQTYGSYSSSSQESWQAYDFEDLFGFRGRDPRILRPGRMAGDSETVNQAVDFINIGRYAYAEQILNMVTEAERDARWYYLKSLANYGMGNMVAAMTMIQRAVQMEPSNQSYAEVCQIMYRTGNSYRTNGQEYQSAAVDMNRFCFSIWLTQLFCSCFWC